MTVPTESCDLVMKGGITSGVIYPRAVARLARHYRLRNLGGTSAGAIAAALAAAAEAGRDSGGIDALEQIPAALGSRLPGLFVPSARTRPIHRVLMATRDQTTRGARKAVKVGTAAVTAWPAWSLAGGLVAVTLPLCGLLLAADRPGRGAAFWLGALLLLPTLLTGLLAGSLAGLGLALLRRLPGEGYGIYSGLSTEPGDQGFTEWMAVEIDRLAGIGAGDPPLTFSRLWGPTATAAWRDEGGQFADASPPLVNLEVMTTDLTHGRALRVPFTEGERFAFCPAELRAVLPPRILAHLEASGGPAGVPCPDHHGPLLHLPDTPDLPVALAARLSVSFPLLIAAVPLWIRASDGTYERSWFSDGGISSNFPVHFFDRLWPRRPTFAIDLQPAIPDGPRITPPSDRPDDRAVWPMGSVPTFVRAVFDTMQNWSDRGTAAQPGFRDRVSKVHLNPTEGGMNLAMTAAQIEALAAAGAAAVEPFLPGVFPETRHRLARFQTATSKLHTTVGQLEISWQCDGWEQLIGSAAPEQAWADDASAYVEALLAGHRRGAPAGEDLSAGAPKPEPDLRLTPHH